MSLKGVLIVVAVFGLGTLGAGGYYVSNGGLTETVVYDCDVLGTYKLVVPWSGEPSFYEDVDGTFELQTSEITPKTIRFWLSDKDRTDNPAEQGGGMVLDRETLQTRINRCVVLGPP